jgi:hypothetical protein
MYDTPKSSSVTGYIEDVGNNGDFTEKEVQQFSTRHFGEQASTYVTPYLYKRPYLGKDFAIRIDDDWNL